MAPFWALGKAVKKQRGNRPWPCPQWREGVGTDSGSPYDSTMTRETQRLWEPGGQAPRSLGFREDACE